MKTRYFYLLILVVSIIAITLGCNKIEGPAIKFTKLVHNFGEIQQGEKVEFSFKFKNPGNEELKIEKVTPTCGCTVAGEYSDTIAPGKSGFIPIVFNSKGFQGDVTKVIQVKTNIPNSELISLTIKGNIFVPIEVQPQNIYMGQTVVDGPPLEGSALLINHTKTPLKIEDIKVSGANTMTKMSTIKEGQEYQIEITEPPPFQLGQFKETMTITTNIEEKKIINIIYSYSGTSNLEISPLEIIFLPENVHDGFMRIVSVVSHTDMEIELLNPSLFGQHMSFIIEEFNPGKGYQIKITFDKEFVFPEKDNYYLRFQLKTSEGITTHTVPIINAEDLQAK